MRQIWFLKLFPLTYNEGNKPLTEGRADAYIAQGNYTDPCQTQVGVSRAFWLHCEPSKNGFTIYRNLQVSVHTFEAAAYCFSRPFMVTWQWSRGRQASGDCMNLNWGALSIPGMELYLWTLHHTGVYNWMSPEWMGQKSKLLICHYLPNKKSRKFGSEVNQQKLATSCRAGSKSVPSRFTPRDQVASTVQEQVNQPQSYAGIPM